MKKTYETPEITEFGLVRDIVQDHDPLCVHLSSILVVCS